MAVVYSQNGTVVRKKDYDLSKFIVLGQEANLQTVGNLVWCINSTNDGWFRTPSLNLSQVSTIEEYWTVYVNSYESTGGGSVAAGSWWTENDYRNFIDVSIYPESIRFLYGNPQVIDYEYVSYTPNTKITIIKKLDANNVNVKVFFNDDLKGERTISRTLLNMPNTNRYFHIGGLRTYATGFGLKGKIDFLHSYIKVDGNLFWGVLVK